MPKAVLAYPEMNHLKAGTRRRAKQSSEFISRLVRAASAFVFDGSFVLVTELQYQGPVRAIAAFKPGSQKSARHHRDQLAVQPAG